MKLHIFGCCAGFESISNYNHTSFALEVGEDVYWFDAGESCSNTAHLKGVDLTKVSNIFISHTHMDRVGGLFNLVWFIYKLAGWYKKCLPNNGKINLFIPNMETWKGILQMLLHTRERCPWDTDVIATQIKDGLIYKDENIEVLAYHNRHQEIYECGSQLSFSFKIRGEEKTIVYSGEVEDLSELDQLLVEHCDYLLIETGKHQMKDICVYVNAKDVKDVICIHHSREILCNISQARLEITKYAKRNIILAVDCDSLIL